MNEKILKIVEESSEFEVDLTPVVDLVTREDIIQLAKIRPNIESFTFGYPDDEALEGLILFKNLKKLYIIESVCLSRCGEWVGSISCLTNLTHLAINNYEDIDLEFIKRLANLKNLISLNLGSSYRINDESIEYFNQFKKLRFLNLNSSEYLTDQEMPYISALNNLEGLELRNTHFSCIVYKKLCSLKNLKYLNLGSSQVNNEVVNFLISKLPKLEMIYLANCNNINSILFDQEIKNSKLNYIFIDNNIISTQEQSTVSINIIEGVSNDNKKLWNSLTKKYQ
jgi:uncharacterized protein YjhX (UPF0386 family)